MPETAAGARTTAVSVSDGDRRPRMPLATAALLVTATAAGVVTGVLGTAAHLRTLDIGGVALPAGLLLAALLAVFTDVALRALGGWVPAVVSGLVRCTVAFGASLPRPEGDLLVAANVRGYTWLAVAALSGAAVAMWPIRRRRGGRP